MELDPKALSGHAKEKAMPEQKPQNVKPKQTADPLPSWNDNNVKRSILDFVTRVSTQGGGEFVPPMEHRCLRQRRYPLVRPADPLPNSLRPRSARSTRG